MRIPRRQRSFPTKVETAAYLSRTLEAVRLDSTSSWTFGPHKPNGNFEEISQPVSTAGTGARSGRSDHYPVCYPEPVRRKSIPSFSLPNEYHNVL